LEGGLEFGGDGGLACIANDNEERLKKQERTIVGEHKASKEQKKE